MMHEEQKHQRVAPVPMAMVILTLVFTVSFASADETKKAQAPVKGADNNEVLATVDGKNVTRTEVLTKAQSQLDAAEAQFNQCRNEYERNKHDVVENKVRQIVQDAVISAEAKAQGVSEDDLLKKIETQPVTDAEVDAFYEQNKARINQPKEVIAPQIKQYLEQQRRAQAFQTFYDKLAKKHEVNIFVEPLRTDVAAIGPSKGPANAPVTIVEFSDFQCPYCARIVPSLDKVKEHYGDKVRLVFRQFPLSIHAQAEKAAEASLCANEQGKFWELHDVMFKNQGSLQPENLVSKAGELGMDREQFKSCLDSGKYAAQVREDAKAGAAAGVSGTPTIYVNGRYLSGAAPFEDIAKIIDEELKQTGNQPAGS